MAILERIYKDVNFPDISGFGVPNLSASPYNLGISRADLWAFAGLLALDEIQSETKTICDEKPFSSMCGDNSTSCYAPFPESGKSMFKTGRSDCIPKTGASEFQGYLTDRIENQPKPDGNGNMTLSFFDDAMGLTGREGLALMGAHTIGRFHPLVISDNDYGWMNAGKQNKLLNNKYYKILAERDAKVQEECTGTMDDQKAPAEWYAQTRFTGVLNAPNPWSTKDREGHLLWTMVYLRGPTCTVGTVG